MTIRAQFVPTHFVAQTWPQCEGYVAKAMPFSNGDYTLEQIKLFVHTGQWSLIVVVDESNAIHGAITVSYINYPNDRIGFVTFVGGKHITNDDIVGQVCDIMRANGATKTQCMARPSAARLWRRFGLRERTTLMEMKL